MEVSTMLGKRFLKGLGLRSIAAVVVLTFMLLATGCSCGSAQPAPTVVVQDASPTGVAPTAAAVTPQPTETPVISGPLVLRMEPTVIPDMVVGETRQVQIVLENVDGITEIEIHVRFEPRYINIADADPTTDGIQIQPGEIPQPAQVLENEVKNDAGFLVYHVAQEPGSSARGSGIVATFTVQAMNEGGSPLSFTIAKWKGVAGEQMPDLDGNDGMVIIGLSDATPETATESAPAPTTPAGGGAWETVQPGDSLYQVCRRHCPHKWPSSTSFDSELKTYAEEVARLNSLGWPNPVLSSGQRLEMPACP
jgi:hypothetical protein